MKDFREAVQSSLLLVGIMSICLLFSCTDEDKTKKTLKSYGFKNIETTGYEFFDCSEDDFYQTGFCATNPEGQRVCGTVCCGMIMKNCTVRF